jgi:GH35 family endo-1,4-beta-xylanase
MLFFPKTPVAGLLVVGFLVLLSSCSQPDNRIPEEYSAVLQRDLPSIAEHYRDDFYVGAAVEPGQLEGAEGALLRYHFNSLTAENAMKFTGIHPAPDTWDFTAADAIADFAREHGLKMRGHTFVWHHPDTIADWMFTHPDGTARSRDEMLDLLEDHIRTIMDRYGDVVYAWDVVNEAIDTSEDDNMRRTRWYEAIGPDYVEQAFRIAHEVDPKAALFYNDYQTYEPAKREALFAFLRDMIDREVPIDGFGMQNHITLAHPTIEAIDSTIGRFRQLGLEIHITELDMSLYTHEFEVLEEAPVNYRLHQGHRYRRLMDVYRSHSDDLTSVTFWGFHDGHTWLTGEPYNRPDWPLPFGANLRSKFAYMGMVGLNLPEDPGIESDKPQQNYAAAYGTPLIDGEVDDAWNEADVVRTVAQVMPADGAVAEVRVLWDETHVYVLAEVADENLSEASSNAYEHDSFEVFIDEDNGKSSSYQSDDAQYRVSFSNLQSVGGQTSTDYLESAVSLIDGGYRVEMAVELRFVAAEPGSLLGIDFQVNDDFGDGVRSGISKWNDLTNESWRNASGWGVLSLE